MTEQATPPVIRKNLIESLSGVAREGLVIEIFAFPDEATPLSAFGEPIAKAMAAAREILRLYPWPSMKPLPPHHPRAGMPYPWRAVTHDQLHWRPVGPDWEPDPKNESLRCVSRDDPPAFLPDLRFDALDFLYWLAAARDATDVAGALVAGWRAAAARARLHVELELRDVLSTGLRQRINAAQKGGRRAAKTDLHARWLAADRGLEATTKLKARARAKRLAPKFDVSWNTFRNQVSKLRKKSAADPA